MGINNYAYVQELPKCIDDDIYLESKLVKYDVFFDAGPLYDESSGVAIKFMHYCSKCDSYLTSDKMEKDLTIAIIENDFFLVNKDLKNIGNIKFLDPETGEPKDIKP